jgi:cellulase/cellobiase CelA1
MVGVRRGLEDERADCADWCNIRGAGVGQLPTSATADSR